MKLPALMRLVAFLAATSALFGQGLTQISGTVTDPSGAAVVGATIEILNLKNKPIEKRSYQEILNENK